MKLNKPKLLKHCSLLKTVMQITSNESTKPGSRIIQYFAAFAATLVVISSNLHYGWISPSLPQLRNGTYRIQIGSEEASWLVNMLLIGTILGAILTAIISDYVGRKRLILFSSVPLFISWILIGVAKTAVLLYIALFIAGLTNGLGFIVVAMFLGEIAEPEIRGRLSALCLTAVIFALLLMNVLGTFLTIPVAAFICAAVSIIHCATFVWIPESPYFLIMKNRHEDARKSLIIYRGTEDVEAELQRISEAVHQQNCDKGKFCDLFAMASNRKALLIVFGIYIIQQLSGIIAIMFYCNTIFQESSDLISPGFGSIIYYSVQLVIVVISCVVVDHFGRKPLLLISISGTFLSLLTCATFLYIKNCTTIDIKDYNFILLVSLLAYIILFSIGLLTAPFVLLAEMFPTNVKAFAICFAEVFLGIISTLVSKFFSEISDLFGIHVPFYFFAVCSALGLVFVIFCVPETKGRTLEEIQEFLKGNLKL